MADPNLVVMALSSPDDVFFLQQDNKTWIAYCSGDYKINDIALRRGDQVLGRIVQRNDDLVVIELDSLDIKNAICIEPKR